jgi:hypothetical protein
VLTTVAAERSIVGPDARAPGHVVRTPSRKLERQVSEFGYDDLAQTTQGSCRRLLEEHGFERNAVGWKTEEPHGLPLSAIGGLRVQSADYLLTPDKAHTDETHRSTRLEGRRLYREQSIEWAILGLPQAAMSAHRRSEPIPNPADLHIRSQSSLCGNDNTAQTTGADRSLGHWGRLPDGRLG